MSESHMQSVARLHSGSHSWRGIDGVDVAWAFVLLAWVLGAALILAMLGGLGSVVRSGVVEQPMPSATMVPR
jgi:hypothetical protein